MRYKLPQEFRFGGVFAALLVGLAACDDAPGDATSGARAAGAANAVMADAPEARLPVSDALQAKGFALGDMVLGSADAPVEVIEYASLTCGHCAVFHAETLPRLKEKYIDTGQVRYVFRNFLLNRVDLQAATVVRCQGSDDFFTMIDLVFSRQSQWLAAAGPEQILDNLAGVVRRAGVSRGAFDQCLGERELQEHIVAMTKAGSEMYDITGTPTIIVNGVKQDVGASRFEALDEIIAGLL